MGVRALSLKWVILEDKSNHGNTRKQLCFDQNECLRSVSYIRNLAKFEKHVLTWKLSLMGLMWIFDAGIVLLV